jgi:hypothetical protein
MALHICTEFQFSLSSGSPMTNAMVKYTLVDYYAFSAKSVGRQWTHKRKEASPQVPFPEKPNGFT